MQCDECKNKHGCVRDKPKRNQCCKYFESAYQQNSLFDAVGNDVKIMKKEGRNT